MNATQNPLELPVFYTLCAEWVTQTYNPSRFLDDSPPSVGEAACDAIDGEGYTKDGLLSGSTGIWFSEGVRFGIAVAAAVAADPLGNPRPGIKEAVREVTAQLRQVRGAQQKDAELEAART